MTKDATVSARIDETLKSQAEDILQQLGIPVSVVINTLYHQIVIQNGVPFPLTLNRTPATLEGMTRTQLDAKRSVREQPHCQAPLFFLIFFFFCSGITSKIAFFALG